ncbi:MAG: hypothetical protein L6V87_11045 [Ruminococcus sp.]|nr:MAG: hypothetical protein L6V87_11045 [Ruminococcus sp.]
MLLFYFRILPKPVNLTMSRELVRDMRAGGWQVYNLVPFSSYSSFVIDPTGKYHAYNLAYSYVCDTCIPAFGCL